MRNHLDNLFFATLPKNEAAAELTTARNWLIGPAVTRMRPERLHLTLLMIDHRIPLQRACEGARSVLADALLPACRIMFDELIGGPHSAFACPSERLCGLERMQAMLAGRLAMERIFPPKWWRFRPHVTLGYGAAPFRMAIDPIGWRAEELVLIRSHVGRSWHETMGRWTLH